MKFWKISLMVVTLAFLGACKADRVIIELDGNQIKEAYAGNDVEVEFQATFEFSGDLDAKKKRMLKEVENIVRSEIQVTDIIVSGDDGDTQVEIEGYFRLSANNLNDPWYLYVSDFGNEFVSVSLINGNNYDSLYRAIKSVKSNFAPKAIQPTTLRLKGKGNKFTVPVGYVDGEASVLWTGTIDGRSNIRFADGILEETNWKILLHK